MVYDGIDILSAGAGVTVDVDPTGFFGALFHRYGLSIGPAVEFDGQVVNETVTLPVTSQNFAMNIDAVTSDWMIA